MRFKNLGQLLTLFYFSLSLHHQLFYLSLPPPLLPSPPLQQYKCLWTVSFTQDLGGPGGGGGGRRGRTSKTVLKIPFHSLTTTHMPNIHTYTPCRAGHLGFAVLQSCSKSYFQANLAIKIIYLWARPIKISYPLSNSLNRKCKSDIFHHSKLLNPQVLQSNTHHYIYSTHTHTHRHTNAHTHTHTHTHAHIHTYIPIHTHKYTYRKLI